MMTGNDSSKAKSSITDIDTDIINVANRVALPSTIAEKHRHEGFNESNSSKFQLLKELEELEELEELGKLSEGNESSLRELDKKLLRKRFKDTDSKTANHIGCFEYQEILKIKKEILNKSLEVIVQELQAQCVAIFIISKKGLLERKCLVTQNKSGEVSIEDAWFPNEKYELGESFTGSAIQRDEENPFGSIKKVKISEDFNNEISALFKSEYERKLGKLEYAIAIPISGSRTAFGVLRIINKIKHLASSKEIDIFKALLSAQRLANSLSNFRRDIRAEVVHYVSSLSSCNASSLISSIVPDRKSFYEKLLNLLIKNSETAYRACVFREVVEENILRVVSVVTSDDELQDNRNDQDRIQEDPNDHLWLSVSTGAMHVIQELQDSGELGAFKNVDWIKKNNFGACAILPLMYDDKLIGSLSIYSGKFYNFDKYDLRFIESFAQSLALILWKVRDYTKSQERFFYLADIWKKETRLAIDSIESHMHWAYQEIIGMGEKALPFILYDLQLSHNSEEGPYHWFGALRAITREQPFSKSDRGNLRKIAEAWLNWATQNNIQFLEGNIDAR